MAEDVAGLRLRAYVEEAATWQETKLTSALIAAAREQGLAGATVLRATEGYGRRGVVHEPHLIDFHPDLPMVVEFIDNESKIRTFLPTVQQMVSAGPITAEPVTILMQRERAVDDWRWQGLGRPPAHAEPGRVRAPASVACILWGDNRRDRR